MPFLKKLSLFKIIYSNMNKINQLSNFLKSYACIVRIKSDRRPLNVLCPVLMQYIIDDILILLLMIWV